MTMQTCEHTIWPSPWGTVIGAISFGTGNGGFTFDSTTDRLAWVGQAPQALTITDISFLTNTVTTGSTLEIRIETVTNGRPSGTLYGTNTNGTVVVANADDTVWKTCTLTASASVSMGSEFAIVIVNSSGTPNMALANCGAISVGNYGATYPIVLQDTGAGTWATSQNMPCWIVSSSSSPVHIPGLMGYASANATAFNSGSSPDEYALKFTIPFKARIAGCVLALANVTAGADYRVFLWDNAGATNTESNALASSNVIDGDSTISATADGMTQIYFTTPYEVAAGTTCYLGVRAETGNSLAIISINVGTSLPTNGLQSFPTGGSSNLSTRAWSAINPGTVGAWTNDATKIPMFRLIIDQFDDGSGGSGSHIQSRVQVGM